MKKILYFFIPIIIAISSIVVIDSYLDKSIYTMIRNKDIESFIYNDDSFIKNKGYVLNRYLSDKKLSGDDYILFFGSSELSHSTKHHPDYFFNNGKTKHKSLTIGKAYIQDLQHAITVGSLGENNKNVVLFISMQWFMDKNGVTDRHFQGRFSPIQFYKMMENNEIDNDTKLKIAKRVCKLLDGSEEFYLEKLYCDYFIINNDDGLKNEAIRMFLKPYLSFRLKAIELKDKGNLYRGLKLDDGKTFRLKNDVFKRDLKTKNGKIDWEAEKVDSLKTAKERIGKKPHKFGKSNLYIDKGYFRVNLKGKDKELENKYSKVDLLDSKEYEDLELFLSVCNDMKIKPVVVITPSMDEFYNHTGITMDKRKKFYSKIKGVIGKYDTDIIDLSSKDTEKYYLRDVMHVGNYGWTDICYRIYEKFEK